MKNKVADNNVVVSENEAVEVTISIPEIKVEIQQPEFKVVIEDGKVVAVVPNDEQ